MPSKIHLSQVLKTKIDIDNVAELSRFGYIMQQNKFVNKPAICPEPCKGCRWRTSACNDFNGDICRHVVDWLNKDFPSKSKF